MIETSKVNFKSNHTKIEQDDDSDIIFVNIWNNENGKLRLTRQKPVLKDTFKEMETANNFSLISNINTQNIPGQNFYNSNFFHPQTPRPVPVGGVGNPKLKESHFENNEKANFYPHLKYATNSKSNDQQLETPETVRKFLSGNRSPGKSTTSEPLLKYLYQGKMNVNIYSIANLN